MKEVFIVFESLGFMHNSLLKVFSSLEVAKEYVHKYIGQSPEELRSKKVTQQETGNLYTVEIEEFTAEAGNVRTWYVIQKHTVKDEA